MRRIACRQAVVFALLIGSAGTIHAQENTMRENPIFGQIFPQGEKLPEEFSAYFIGQAYRAPKSGEVIL